MIYLLERYNISFNDTIVLQAASKSLKTVDHNYSTTPTCFRQSTPIIYSQYPVWVQFVYILWYPVVEIFVIFFFRIHFVVFTYLRGNDQTGQKMPSSHSIFDLQYPSFLAEP